MDEEPITPNTGPTLDAEGRLTYIGEDGHRYLVLDKLELDRDAALRVADVLQAAGGLFDQIEALSQRWIDQVCAGALEREEVVALLLATLETVLADDISSGDEGTG